MGFIPPEVLRNIEYRLSRVYVGGVQKQTLNKVYIHNDPYTSGGANFVEGFNAKEVIIESNKASWSFRRNTAVPYISCDFEKLICVGDQYVLPQIRSRLSLTPLPTDINVSEVSNLFSFKLLDVNASGGLELETKNSEAHGTTMNIAFHYRDVRSLSNQRNVLCSRDCINATPKPEETIEPLIRIQETTLA